MVAARGLVVVVVVPDKGGRVLRQGVDHAARPGITAALVVGRPLGVECRALFVARLLAVLRVKIPLGIDPAHVIHGRGNGGAHPGVKGCRIECHAAPAANAEQADFILVHVFAHQKKVNGRLKVLGVDVGGGDISGKPAALSRKGGVKGNGQKAALRQLLRIKSRALFLDGAKGAANGNCRKGALLPLGGIQVGRQRDAVAVVEGDFSVLHPVAFWENLIPFVR